MTAAELDYVAILRAERDRLFDVQQGSWKAYIAAVKAQRAIDRAIDAIVQFKVDAA